MSAWQMVKFKMLHLVVVLPIRQVNLSKVKRLPMEESCFSFVQSFINVGDI